jgi:hypothetical protein
VWENKQRNKSLERLFSMKVKKLQSIIPKFVFEHKKNVNIYLSKGLMSDLLSVDWFVEFSFDG